MHHCKHRTHPNAHKTHIKYIYEPNNTYKNDVHPHMCITGSYFTRFAEVQIKTRRSGTRQDCSFLAHEPP